uniref:Uncharacterized protein n=1 Tax=Cucumis melo TaxID=3656 RepID=A0A9I9EDG8_CUCME
ERKKKRRNWRSLLCEGSLFSLTDLPSRRNLSLSLHHQHRRLLQVRAEQPNTPSLALVAQDQSCLLIYVVVAESVILEFGNGYKSRKIINLRKCLRLFACSSETFCELFVSSHGNIKKLASGLVKPFVTQLQVSLLQKQHFKWPYRVGPICFSPNLCLMKRTTALGYVTKVSS